MNTLPVTHCSVCRNRFTTNSDRIPKLLPCSCTICLPCLQQFYGHSCAKYFKCPECDKTNEVPCPGKFTGMSSFPTNVYVLETLEVDDRLLSKTIELCKADAKVTRLTNKLETIQQEIELLKTPPQEAKAAQEAHDKKVQELKEALDKTASELKHHIQETSKMETAKLDTALQQVRAQLTLGKKLKEKMDNRPRKSMGDSIQHLIKIKEQFTKFKASAAETRKDINYKLVSFREGDDEDKAGLEDAIGKINSSNVVCSAPKADSCKAMRLRSYADTENRETKLENEKTTYA